MRRREGTIAALVVAGLLSLVFVAGLVVGGGRVAAVSYAPTVYYDFSGASTDSMGNSTLTFAPSCATNSNPCNVTSGYGSDVKGTYWSWTAKPSTRGGGFWIDTDTAVDSAFSVAFRVSFKETDCYRTIIDFSDGTDDNHLYFCDGIQFYPRAVSAELFAPNTVYDILISRLSNGTIRAYKLDGTGQAVQILEVADLPSPQRSMMVPAAAPGGGSRLRFFHDECCEYTSEGKVYDVRIWANQVLPPEQFASASATTTTTSTSTTTTTTSTTTTVPTTTTVVASTAPAPTTVAPALDIVVNAPTSTVVTGSTTALGQSRTTAVPVVSTPSRATGATSSTVRAVTTTTSTLPPNAGGTVAPKPPAPPTVVAGGAAVQVGDSLEEPTVERSDNQLVVTAGPLKAVVGGLNPDGSVMPLEKDGSVRLRMGDKVRIKLAGFMPGRTMEAWLFSAPALLGTAKVGADGTVTATFDVPRDTPPGPHRVVVVARTKDGKPATLAVGVNVGEWQKESSLTLWLIATPIVVAVVGALVLPATRRRRPRTTA